MPNKKTPGTPYPEGEHYVLGTFDSGGSPEQGRGYSPVSSLSGDEEDLPVGAYTDSPNPQLAAVTNQAGSSELFTQLPELIDASPELQELIADHDTLMQLFIL